ncbi:hypothetical protein BN14_00260 [Rhizoctonia solani AG-1 IB]|uniref:Mitochondrial carrier n=1 Tax=Thanatephorus cucumeris (strain AG1-IB / isolate 7/3/14) TaxID=1108050 RepID=M5BJQ2_THACB|nr:hypothetical protein BN14_00260 [Rhizoctonia solani AG-1 IB]
MASSSTPNSLRDLYAAPPDGWSFFPAPEDLSSSGTKSSASPWPSRSARSADSHVFDLAPLASDVVSLDPQMAIKALVASGALQYATTAIAMPFEVGKVLLQIQWVPKDHVGPAPDELIPDEKEEDALSDASGDSYFHDPDEPRSRIRLEPTQPRLADEEGRMGNDETGWQVADRGLAVIVERTIDIMYNRCAICGPPTSSPFIIKFSIYAERSYTIAFPLRHVAPRETTCNYGCIPSSDWDYSIATRPSALRDIYYKEGGLAGMYLHPNLLIPTVIENTLRPLLALSAPLFIERTLFVTEESHPVAYQVAELLFSSATLLLTLPIETARRRLQIQSRGSGRFQACVETRPSPYTGVADVLWKVLTEERSMPITLRRRRMSSQGRQTDEEVKEKRSWINSTGIGQLYRGFGMGMGASGVVFLLATLAGGDSDAGWAEL